MRLCNGRIYLKVAFSKIPKFSQKITILENSFSNFSKVVGLKENCNSNFCVAPKTRLVKIIKSSVTEEVTVRFYKFGEANF